VNELATTEISVLITSVGGGGVGTQILKSLQMAETPYRLIGVDMSPTAYGLYTVDSRHLVPASDDPEYLNLLLKICDEDKVKVLIPSSEFEALQVSRNREKFSIMGVTPIVNPPEVIETCADKSKTVEFLKSNGLNYPKTVIIEKESDLSKVDFFPVVIKPAKSTGGSRNVYIAQTKDELSFFANYLLRQRYFPLVQEYVGSPDEEYTVGVIALDDGEIGGSIALRRYIRTGLSKKLETMSYSGLEPLIVSSGVSEGEVKDFPEIREYSELIAKKLGAKGPINIQGRNTKDGFYPFEINPRFSGSTSIRAMLGFNEPDLLIRYHILGEKPSGIKIKHGIVVRGLKELCIPFTKIEELQNKLEHLSFDIIPNN
jgi:carbamoyl-phosphate synthase large subunit